MPFRRNKHFFFLLLLTGLGLPRVQAEIAITQVSVDSRENRLAPQTANNQYPAMRLPYSTKPITISFQNEARPDQRPVRLRYKLEGVDADWFDLPSGMVVWLRLLDKAGNFVAGNTLDLTGETPGWNGRPEDAPLAPLQISVTAPPSADRFRLYFISHKNTKEIGQLIAADVTVRVHHADGRTGETVRVDYTSGQNLNRPSGMPANWNRDGERLEIAQMLKRTAPTEPPALFLNDDDPDKFGGWRSYDLKVPLEPGDHLTMECRTAYSIGSGESKGVARYERLKPGTYWFRVGTVYVNGLPAGHEVSLPLIILPPLVQRLEFWIVTLVALAILLSITVRWVTQQQSRRQMEIAERRRLLEEERNRIARDIHDDLGTTMTQIAMLSESAQTYADDKMRGFLNDIFSRAHLATRSLDEIVWAIKPENDTLESLIRYLSRFAEGYLRLAGLRFRLDVPDDLPDHTLTSAQRHNLFLTAKEALHNVVKHARATEVWLRIGLRDDVLHLRIEDNGTGTVPAPDAPLSRGSANMKKRMEQIGGSYQRTGIPGTGTTIEVAFPLRRHDA